MTIIKDEYILLLNGCRISTETTACELQGTGPRKLEQQAIGVSKAMHLSFCNPTKEEILSGYHSIWEGPRFRAEPGEQGRKDRLVLVKPKGNWVEVASVVEEAARELIEKPDGLGCEPYRSPIEWRERKEEWGCDAELIICHDGGDYAEFFNHDYGRYDSIDHMARRLDAAGFWAEQCTTWYTAIYKR